MDKKIDIQYITNLIDLTALSPLDNEEDIKQLCNNAIKYKVAAVCIYSHFIPLAKEIFTAKQIEMPIATVVNFPTPLNDLELTKLEIKLALSRGADEIDIVLPYYKLQANQLNHTKAMLSQAKELCQDKTVKVIIESGELKTRELIELASQLVIDSGCDFIKTSTGFVKENATLSASEIILNVIKANGKKCGFKASGGIKSLDIALSYIQLTNKIMGDGWISNSKFRFGTSSLLNDIITYNN